MAALNVLEPRHVFGAKGDVRANVHYLDETTVLYAAGNQIVLHHVESNTQRFVPGAPDAEGITALALSPNRKFLAIAERGEKATISVLDLTTHAKRRKVLSSAEVNAKEYVSLSFSPDGKSIVACGGGPEWNVVVFRWEKLRCVGVVPARAPNAPVAPVREILWNPSEPSTASLVGVGSFRIFKMTETGARPMPSALGKRNAGAFTAHCWLPTEATGATGTGTESNPGNNNTRNKESERGAAGQTGDGKERKEKESGQKEKTHDDHKKKDGKGADGDKQSGTQVCVVADDAGELLIVENGEVRAVLPSPGLHSGIDVVVAHGTKGFICGGEHGKIYMYEKTDDQQMFKLVKTFSVPIFSESGPDGRNESRSTQASEGHHVGGAAARIKSLTLSPSEETLVCGLQNNQIYVVDLVDADILKEEEMQFEMLSSAFHEEGICGIDACVKKPLVATCSSDKTVRIWNYLDMSCELAKEFPEEALSVSFHPSGLHVLVGFTDKLRLCNLLLDDIRPYKEFPIKNCAECCFSNGGHLFAAVNGSVVMVYDAYTCENIGNFRGHGGRVTSVSWGLDDQTIVSAGVDGAVYEWTPKTFARNKENVKKGTEYLCAVQSVDGENAYAVGFDAVTKTSVLREFDMTHQLVREIDTEVLLTQIAMPRSAKTGALFAASAGGSVRAYRFPLTGEFQTLDCHGASISQIVLSHDDSTLFVASNDGCVSVFDVKDKDGASLRGRGKDAFSEEVLVTKADMEETLSKTSALEMRVAELTLENEQELRAHTTNMNLKIKDLTEKFTAELEGDKARFETLAQSKNEQELQFETDLKSAEDVASSQAADTEQGYSRKMLAEVERYQALVCERDLLNEKWDEQNAALAERHERVVQELTEEFAGKLREEVRLREKMRRKLDLGTRESDTVIDQMEEDMDLEVLEIKQKYELRLAEAQDVGLRLKGENGIMKKKFNQLQKDIHEQKETILGLGDDKKQLRQTIGDLKTDLTGLRKELWDRDDTIGDKERRIYDLKKKTQELEKFKFVLDYKIKQLKKQIEPRELDVADMKTTIKQMDHELEKYHKSNAYLELSITDLKHKLVGVQKDEVKQRELVTLHKSQIKSFQADLHETSRQTLYPKKLAASVNALYQKHVMSGSVVDNGLDEDVQKEFQRQRLFLEKTIENLKRKLAKDVEGHRSDVARVLGENVVLLKEVNELRRESKLAKQRQKAQLVTSAGNHGGAHRSQLGVGFSEENPGDPAVSLTPGSKVPREIDFSVDVARELEQLRVSLAEARLEIQIKDAQVRELEKSAGAGRTGATGGDVQDRANDPDLEAAVSAMAMRQAENEEKAATNIQAMHRGNAARREVDAMRQEAQAEEPPPLDKEDSLGAM